MKTYLFILALVMLSFISSKESYSQQIRHERWKLSSVDLTVNYSDNGLPVMKSICIGGGSTMQNIALGILSASNNHLPSGAEISYKRYLLSQNESTNIYVSLLSQFNFDVSLTDNLNSLIHSKEFSGEYEKFNTLDIGLGFGLKQYLSQSVSIWASLYYNYYKRQIIPSEDRRIADFSRFSDDKGVTINLKIGVSIEF